MKIATTVLSTATLASMALAQSPSVTIPRLAERIEGNDIASYPFGRTGFRTQQIIDETALISQGGGGFVVSIDFRADTGNSSGSQAVSIPNVSGW